MFGIQNYSSFIMAVVLFQLMPGAGTITILNATSRAGIGGGMKAVYGTLSGDFVYMLAAVLGLAALLEAHPSILVGAQSFGVGYLCWIGLKLLFSSVKYQTADINLKSEQNWTYFRQALGVSLTNPKVIMFFMAFFPLFLNAESAPVTLLTLMVHVTFISFVMQTGLVVFGNAASKSLGQWNYARVVFNRLAGVAFIGFGVKLALNNR